MNTVPVLSYPDALRRAGEVAPWQPSLVVLCVCVVVLALARRRRTLLYAPTCALLGLTLLLWLGLPSGGDPWANLVLAPWMTWTLPALALCMAVSVVLWLLREKIGSKTALISVVILIFVAMLCRFCAPQWTYTPQAQRSYLEADAPTAFYRPWTNTDLTDYSEFRTTSTMPLPIYADASTDTPIDSIPDGWSIDPHFVAAFYPTIERGWRAVELEENGKTIGYVRTADLLRMIRTADCEDNSLMRKLWLRNALFAQDHNSWYGGNYLTPDVVYVPLPFEAPMLLAMCMATAFRLLRSRRQLSNKRPT